MNNKEPLFHLVKRVDASKRLAWGIRIGAFVISILVCALASLILSDKGIGFFFKHFFGGIFGSGVKFYNLIHEAAILLLVALAVTPCFKMKFWNIGGEGQMLMGALGAAVVVRFLGDATVVRDATGSITSVLGGPLAGVIILSLLSAMAFGAIWAVIPAIFKAFWNTNETLLTLMLNYVATCLVWYFVKKVMPAGTGVLNFDAGIVPPILGDSFVLKILVALTVMVFLAVYLNKSKHGYELSVVGESERTAKYVGINIKKVIIRTLLLSGMLCGIIGFLLVSATNNGIHATDTVDGRGFTGVLLSWLAHFNPYAMALTSFLYVFVEKGATQVGDMARLGSSYPDVMTGIFFFCIVSTEFFINYKIIFRDRDKVKAFLENKVFKKKATEAVVEDVIEGSVEDQVEEDK